MATFWRTCGFQSWILDEHQGEGELLVDHAPRKTGSIDSMMTPALSAADSVIVPRQGAAILPVLDPMFNLREVVKQMILVEDHLVQPLKRCPDCIGKHLLWWEALAEEGCSLDRSGQAQILFCQLADASRRCQMALLAGQDPSSVAQWIRDARKTLLKAVFPWKRPTAA